MAMLNRKKISGNIVKTKLKDGHVVAVISSIKLLEKEPIKSNDVQKYRDMVGVKFGISAYEQASHKFNYSFSEESYLVKLIKAAVGNDIREINDLEGLLKNKKVIIKLENRIVNAGSTSEKTYTNVVDIFPISMNDEFKLEDNTVTKKNEIMEMFTDNTED